MRPKNKRDQNKSEIRVENKKANSIAIIIKKK